jgi:hypothetical protein
VQNCSKLSRNPVAKISIGYTIFYCLLCLFSLVFPNGFLYFNPITEYSNLKKILFRIQECCSKPKARRNEILEKAFEQYRVKSTLAYTIYTYEFQNKLLNSGMQTVENIIHSPPILVLIQIYCTL